MRRVVLIKIWFFELDSHESFSSFGFLIVLNFLRFIIHVGHFMNVIVFEFKVRSVNILIVSSCLDPILIELIFLYLTWEFFLDDISW